MRLLLLTALAVFCAMMPGHHVLCFECAEKVPLCPVDRTAPKERVRTFGR